MLWGNKIGKELLKICLCFSLSIALGKSMPAPTRVVTLSSAPRGLEENQPCAFREPRNSLGPEHLKAVAHPCLLLWLPWAGELQPKAWSSLGSLWGSRSKFLIFKEWLAVIWGSLGISIPELIYSHPLSHLAWLRMGCSKVINHPCLSGSVLVLVQHHRKPLVLSGFP